MARVYSAPDINRGAARALKVVDLSGLGPQEARETAELFRQETEILRRLDHPGFPLVVDAFDQGALLCLVMEMGEGRTLESIVTRNGPCPENSRGLAECLGVLHTHGPYPAPSTERIAARGRGRLPMPAPSGPSASSRAVG